MKKFLEKKGYYLFTVIFFFSAVTFADQSITEQQMLKKYKGVVNLIVNMDEEEKDKEGNNYFIGSAVFIGPNVLVTAAHVINPKIKNKKIHIDLFNPQEKQFISLDFEILQISFKYDLAILKINNYRSDTFYSLEESGYHETSGDFVVVGNPSLNFRVMRADMILQREDLFIDIEPRSLINNMSGMNGMSGMSGGGVFNETNGHLLGIVIQQLGVTTHIRFVSVEQIHKMLARPALSCDIELCLKDQMSIFTTQAHNGDPVAQYKLSLYSDRSPYWLRQSSDQGFLIAKLHLANIYFTKGEVDASFQLYRELANNGFVTAQLKLALMYLKGYEDKVKVDYEESFYWMQMVASQKKSLYANYFLSMMYYRGMGVDQDFGKAFDILYQNSHAGHVASQAQISGMYCLGQGVNKNYENALYWAKTAYENSIVGTIVFRTAKEVLKILLENKDACS